MGMRLAAHLDQVSPGNRQKYEATPDALASEKLRLGRAEALFALEYESLGEFGRHRGYGRPLHRILPRIRWKGLRCYRFQQSPAQDLNPPPSKQQSRPDQK